MERKNAKAIFFVALLTIFSFTAFSFFLKPNYVVAHSTEIPMESVHMTVGIVCVVY